MSYFESDAHMQYRYNINYYYITLKGKYLSTSFNIMLSIYLIISL